MKISEIRVNLVENRNDRLKAFCSITFDDAFVVRDLKIIKGTDGYFVAMPSRKLSDRCPQCGHKNHLRARYCNECGGKLEEDRAGMDHHSDSHGRIKLHADVAHPVNSHCREYIQGEIIQAYESELERSRQPGYRPAKLHDDYDDDHDYYHHPVQPESPVSNIAELGAEEAAHAAKKQTHFSEGIL